MRGIYFKKRKIIKSLMIFATLFLCVNAVYYIHEIIKNTISFNPIGLFVIGASLVTLSHLYAVDKLISNKRRKK